MKALFNSLDRGEKISLLLVFLGMATALFYGWRLFWFMTDDAYIAFRYVSNSILGRGYVWNPAPFRPVEGYTSFLWVSLLDVIWRVAGIEPPVIANKLSFGFSFLSLTLISIMVLDLNWKTELRRYRIFFLILILSGMLFNRTFLAWTSSGLETAMFNFYITLWLYSILYFQRGSRIWVFLTTFTVLLIYLTRPDGLLFALATIFVLLLSCISKNRFLFYSDLIYSFPLVGIPVHIIWRKGFYGEWLPNTYYAKVAGGIFWAESGLKYLLSFVIEYAFWVWVIVFAAFLVSFIRNVGDKNSLDYIKITLFSAILGHISYYTLIVGGDYFEYRVYSYLPPLIFLSFVWFLNHLSRSPLQGVLSLILFVLLSLPIPWVHWVATKDLYSRDETLKMVVPVAGIFQEKIPFLPGQVVSYLSFYDDLQRWLIGHYVGVRHQELKALSLRLEAFFPDRSSGEVVQGNYPVIAQQAVGVVGWVLPNVNIIDLYGLNDYVIARNPELRVSQRMAHLRMPPEGYDDCFLPNVKIQKREAILVERPEPLTAEKIVYCEQTYLQKVLTSP